MQHFQSWHLEYQINAEAAAFRDMGVLISLEL